MNLRLPIFVFVLAIAACAQEKVVGEVFTSDASVHGSIVFASGGMQITSGSTVAAGSATTVVKLARGGEVRLCAGTGLTINATPRGNSLLMSMNAGDMELHFGLRSSADTLVTPDFRITLAGPGEFHVALGADRVGNTCIRALHGNTASLLVAEVFGDGVYQVKPNEHISFHGGKVSEATDQIEPCGCPAPASSQVAKNKPSTPPVAQLPPVAMPPPVEVSSLPVIAAVENPQMDQVKPVVNLAVETPFVYNAGQIAEPALPVEPVHARVALPEVPASSYLARDNDLVNDLPQYSVLQILAPPTLPEKKAKKTFGSRFRSFFASIFH